jgi:hypothetical protein
LADGFGTIAANAGKFIAIEVILICGFCNYQLGCSISRSFAAFLLRLWESVLLDGLATLSVTAVFRQGEF